VLAYAASDWAKPTWVLVDERCVPEADPRLNFAMIRSALVDQVPIPPAQVHPMPVGLPDGDDRAYQVDLRRALADGRLDAAVLAWVLTGTPPASFPIRRLSTSAKLGLRFNDGERVLQPRPRMT